MDDYDDRLLKILQRTPVFLDKFVFVLLGYGLCFGTNIYSNVVINCWL
jgi:hypothetical protein